MGVVRIKLDLDPLPKNICKEVYLDEMNQYAAVGLCTCCCASSFLSIARILVNCLARLADCS